jgi:UTP-glucose-1-phosphate uridylyltransferase
MRQRFAQRIVGFIAPLTKKRAKNKQKYLFDPKIFEKCRKTVMKMFVRLHLTNAIVRSREEHAARTINACAAAGLRDLQEC